MVASRRPSGLGQFITEPRRGITVAWLLTYLLAARERGGAPQLLALAAVIGGHVAETG